MWREKMTGLDTGKRFLRLNDVKHKTGLSRSSIYSFMGNGTFPKNIKIGARCVCWHEEAIEKWMQERMMQAT
jgi:prophage regulatory protein